LRKRQTNLNVLGLCLKTNPLMSCLLPHGVTSGIDFGLSVVAEIAGEPVAQAIQLGLEYDPAPPFKLNHPDARPTLSRRRSFPDMKRPERHFATVLPAL
jgi:hypothetical protein